MYNPKLYYNGRQKGDQSVLKGCRFDQKGLIINILCKPKAFYARFFVNASASYDLHLYITIFVIYSWGIKGLDKTPFME